MSRGVQERVFSLPWLKSRKDNWAESIPARSPPAQGVQGEVGSCPGGQPMPRGPWSWAPPRRGGQPCPRGGGWAAELRRGRRAPGRAESRLSPRVQLRRGVCAGRCAFWGGFSLFRCCLRTAGAEVSEFSPSPSSGGTPLGAAALPHGERAGPGAGPGACLPLCPPRAVRGTCVQARGAPAPFPRPLTAGCQPRPPRAARHGALAAADTAGPPRSTPSAESQSGGRGGGGPERSLPSPAPGPPPSSPAAANRRGGKRSCR